MLINKIPAVIVATSATILLAACGGGSSAPAAGNSPPQLASSLTIITQDNAKPTAGNVFNVAQSVDSTAATSAALVTGVSLSSAAPSASKAAVDLFTFVIENRKAPMLTGVSFSENCPNGGTVTLSGTIQNENHPTAGDNITLSAANCVINGVALDGAYSIAVNSLNGTVSSSTAWNANLGLRFSNLRVAAGGDAIGVSGDMAIGFSQSDASHRKFDISGASLNASLVRNGNPIASRTLSAYSGVAQVNGTTSTTIVDYGVSGSSNLLKQFNVNVKTIRPFLRENGGYPTQGSLIVSGAASSVTLTAIDATNVRLDYSAKGDGVITATQTTTWVDLQNSI